MKAERFIARKLQFKGKVAAVATAISFLVIILSTAVSQGFRREIRKEMAEVSGDILLCGPRMNCYTDAESISSEPYCIDAIRKVDGVKEIRPVIYRAGIVKAGDEIHGVIFKGIENSDSSLTAVIPSSLARKTGLEVGDRMLSYFLGENTRARNFKIREVRNDMIETNDRVLVLVPAADLRRINGWSDKQVSALEIVLDDRFSDRYDIKFKASEIGSIALMSPRPDNEEILTASATPDRYPQIFDWLDLIDINVTAILLMMIVVAGFNMISGLLIMLMRSVSTIGILKAMGMKNSGIAGIFLRISSVQVLKGMVTGNVIGLALCTVQHFTHFLKLNPENYFLSFVPVSIDVPKLLFYDIAAYAGIMALLLIPTLFISKVDPAESVKVR